MFRALTEGLNPYRPGVLPDGLRRRLQAATHPGALVVQGRSIAQDQTTKLAAVLADGAAVECVLIPDFKTPRATLCVSSQVGCARGCEFCVTATMGLKRNLTTAEIIQQVDVGLREARRRHWRLRNLVFMGMGEPLDNANHVRAAVEILTDHRGYGFAPRHVTLSTVGPRLAAVRHLAGWPLRIAWSLHAARPEVRARLVPKPHPDVTELAAAFATVCRADRRPLFIEMTLMDGVNDKSEDMAAAAALMASFPTEVRFNLIAMNPGRAGLRPARGSSYAGRCSSGPAISARSPRPRTGC